MRVLFLFSLLAVLATTVLAWTKEDHEIFDLVSAVEKSEGKGTTFYSWLGLHSTASVAQIGKAYRKKSMQLHPDKNPGVKGVQERFARLGVVAAILRNSEARERYDFFYKNGVPKWRGTGYYYSRFRPGLGFVLTFLVILTSGLQYIVQKMNYKRDLERIERFTREARAVAWGAKMIPLEGQRKVKVNLGGGSRFDDDGNVVNGKWIDMVVEGQSVYILDENNELHPLDSSSATPPSVKRTWFIALGISVFEKYVPKRTSSASAGPASADIDADSGNESSGTGSETPGSGAITPDSKENGASGVSVPTLKGKRAAVSKTGGMRRKAAKRR